MTEYTIRGGETDADRLARQAEVMAAASLTFLTHCGAHPGAAIVDIGCGDGQIAHALTRRGGHVVGIDTDPDAIAIARRSAGPTFRVQDAAVPAGNAEFDLAYSRLLLSHLVDAPAVVRAMCIAVKTGGTVAVEDLYSPSLAAEPHVPALTDLAEIYCATVRHSGGDPAIGPRLVAHLRAAGLTEVTEVTVVNRITDPHDKRFLVQLVDNMHPAILAAGAATEPELARVRTDVAAAADEPDVTFLQARMHQVAGRKS